MAIILHHEDGSTEEIRNEKESLSKPASGGVIVYWDQEEGFEPAPEPPTSPDDAALQRFDEAQIKMGELYRRKQRIANHLVDIFDNSDDERRKALVDEMRALRKEYNRLYEDCEHFKKHGVWPAGEKEEKHKLTDLQKHELLRRRGNVASNVSKAKSMVKKHQHNPEKLVKYQQKQAALEAELQEIDELLRR